jgi:formate hydrogenlyase subunit 3/multisubunit Na+/H+ antiporter MnhD subunit
MTVPTETLLLGATLILWLALLPLCIGDGPHTNRRPWSGLIGAGSATLLASALITLSTGNDLTLPPLFFLGTVPSAFRLDSLAAWFLAVVGVVGVPVALYLPGYMDHLRERVDMRVFWSALAVLFLSMAGVVLAANVQTFLVLWELMSLSSFLLVASDHRNSHTRHAAFVYLGATRVGTAFLAGGFLWAHALTGSWAFHDWHLSGLNALGPGLLLLIGLGVKAGMWPFHLWLPAAHPAAPAPVSALMSGVMVKVAIYMMARLFLLSPAFAHPAFGYIVLVLGAISALWGILFALLQPDIKRILAYSTVENVGLILIALAGAIAADRLGLKVTAQLGAGAALFHVLNHALFKSLLFLGAGSVDHAAHTRELDRLGGLGARMPGTYALFALGAAAICGLPPLNGFASEWLLYQGSLQMAGSGAAALLRFCGMIMIGWVALVGALALACFVRTLGVAFLGRPRSAGADHAHEVAAPMLAAKALLAGGCVVLGLGVPALLPTLQRLVAPLAPGSDHLVAAWTLPMGAVVLVMAATLGVGALWLRSAAVRQPTRSYITWECGFGPLGPRMQVAAASFSQPIARLFGALFRYAVELKIDGSNRRLFPEEITVRPKTETVLESRVYHPLVRWVDRAGDWIVRLQAGSIQLYLLTMFATLLVLLIVGGWGGKR